MDAGPLQLARRGSCHRRQAIGGDDADFACLAERISRIAQTFGLEIGPAILRALAGERPNVGAIRFRAWDRSAGFDLLGNAQRGDEGGCDNCGGDYGVEGLEHDTDPLSSGFGPCFWPRGQYACAWVAVSEYNLDQAGPAFVDADHIFAVFAVTEQ